jgi:hypothetical protein
MFEAIADGKNFIMTKSGTENPCSVPGWSLHGQVLRPNGSFHDNVTLFRYICPVSPKISSDDTAVGQTNFCIPHC